MKIRLAAILLSLICAQSLLSQSFDWVKQMGGPNEKDVGVFITVDASGTIHSTGFFADTADFDPGPGVNNLFSNGARDVYVQKMDPSGFSSWTKQIGGDSTDQGLAIATDINGNMYLTGNFKDTVDFDPGAGVEEYVSNGEHDIFILKLDAGGNFVWTKQIGGTQNDNGFYITVDNLGNSYITGQFHGTADFDPGPGSTVLVNPNTNPDAFFTKTRCRR